MMTMSATQLGLQKKLRFIATLSQPLFKTGSPISRAVLQNKKMAEIKPILCVGMVCEDTIVKVDKFPTEDSDQRTLDQWKTRGGNASNMSTILSSFGFKVE